MNDAGRHHAYRVSVRWTGNRGPGTISYRGYGREHFISAPTKPDIAGSSDPAFQGDATRWNPEELLVASLSACHKLWYLHLCAVAGLHVMEYEDEACGEMAEGGDGAGHFVAVTLHPRVTLPAGSDAVLAADLHEEAHAKCFIANSVNFPVTCLPTIVTG